MSSNSSTSTDVSTFSMADDIAVIITTFNDADYLSEALASVCAQTPPPREIIVIDDGSEISPAAIVQAFPQASLIRTENGGLARARNVGLHAARSTYICFLDADDRLTPEALSSGLASLRQSPDAAFTYGGHRRIHGNGAIASPDMQRAVGSDPYMDLLEGNLIGMHGSVLYRRELLATFGGFEERLRRCEDYDLYLRVARSLPIVSHSETVAEYRWHGKNMSANTEKMLETALHVHAQHRPEEGSKHQASWERGRNNWTDWYTTGQEKEWTQFAFKPGYAMPKPTLSSRLRSIARELLYRLRPGGMSGGWPPRVGSINFGSFNSTVPASKDFGWERGTPIDRYYIENFLAANAVDIQGRVLEVGDDTYSRQFGGTSITQQDVLHVSAGHPKATLTGDITNPGTLPANAFDCIVFTQTLHAIFELQEAVTNLVAALKPGGVLLLTVPGISQVDRLELRTLWCWSFTRVSLERLFSKHFTRQALEITSFGNVFAAVSLLFGASLQEVSRTKLDEIDPAYPVILTLKARKAH